MLEHPADRYYTTRRVWVRLNEDRSCAEVGVTPDVMEELPEVLGIDLPLVGDEVEMDVECLHLHTLANVVGISAPLSGRVLKVNAELEAQLEDLLVHPYQQWLFVMEYDEPDELEMLLDSDDFEDYLDSL